MEASVSLAAREGVGADFCDKAAKGILGGGFVRDSAIIGEHNPRLPPPVS